MTQAHQFEPQLPTMAALLDLEELDRDLYRGINEFPTADRPTLFGGQVAAQALKAAGLTVPEGRLPHSMHGYFLRTGWRARPIVFKVERDRDGKSFSARRVSALQNGEVIFDLTASFHVEESGGEYGQSLPVGLPGPGDCAPEPYSHNFPNADARPVPPLRRDANGNLISATVWIKTRERLADDLLTHACALTYLSDIATGFANVEVDRLPSGGPSLDHAVWFRTPLRADEWNLMQLSPLMAGGARGLYGGSIHSVDGTLGAMLTQEALMRPPVVPGA
ncbi:MAG: thioesterase family protein [Actinomycetota bacterium]|nr:thioesterase family protein [Actinomycetota bacterium]